MVEPSTPVVSKPVDTTSAVKIAVVLPFSGENAEFAEQVFNGAKIASLTAEKCGQAIRLVPFDTEGDKIIGAGLLRDIAKDPSFIAAIGPLTSDESAVAAATLSGTDLPLIVPAASDIGFTELSSTVFQLTPNIAVQAERMAAYAVDQLHADTAVILTSDDPEHRRMAESFANRFTRSGGVIAVQIFYISGEKDFKSIIGDIKFSLRPKDSDSLSYVNNTGDTLDNAERPIRIDCIYMPGKPEQVRLLLPQLRFYNVNSTNLGSDEWGDQAVYGLGTAVLKYAVFPSAYILPQETEEAVRFASKYLTEYQTAAGRLARVGYDALSCICSGLSATATRASVASHLLSLRQYSGLSGGVTLTTTRVNTALPIYHVQNGQPVLVEEQPVSAESSSDDEL
jgi:branched-chain amino acid transport system substrate-binding protein